MKNIYEFYGKKMWNCDEEMAGMEAAIYNDRKL